MQTLRKIVLSSIVAFGAGAFIAGIAYPAAGVAAAPACSGADCVKIGAGSVETGPDRTIGEVVQIITNVLLFIIGVVSVIMIVIGGIRYTTSNGDSNKVAAAKNTILYAVIGLIVAILAYALVDFVIDTFTAP